MSYIGTEPKDVRSFGRAKFDYTASQGQTAFTGADDDSKTLAFTDGQIEVFVNGILMDESDFSTSNGNTVTLASAANLNDIVSITALQTDIPNSDYVPATGGTFSGDVDFGSNKITYANLYNNLSDLPSASTYHGMFAHVHNTGLAYYSHAGAWIPLANTTGATFSGNIVASDGINIGGTGADNKLDDYEEGAWTPSANNGSFTGIIQGRYTKVGNKVTAWAYIQSINDTTTSSNLEISGLPFSPASSGVLDSTVGPIMLRYLDVGVTEEIGVVVWVNGGGSALRIYVLQANGTYTPVQNAHFSNGGIGFRFSITYQV